MDFFSNNLSKPTQFFKKYLLEDGEVWYMPFFIAPTESKKLFAELSKDIDWQQESIRMFGKTHLVPRKIAWYGDKGVNYKYAGIPHLAEPWTSALEDLRKRVELETGDYFNSVLLNRYENGSHKMGWHADNEKELGTNPVIASVSFGATRRFDLKHNSISKGKSQEGLNQKLQIDLESGSLLLMKGALQHHWKHQIPMQKKVTEPRINLTFRNILSIK